MPHLTSSHGMHQDQCSAELKHAACTKGASAKNMSKRTGPSRGGFRVWRSLFLEFGLYPGGYGLGNREGHEGPVAVSVVTLCMCVQVLVY